MAMVVMAALFAVGCSGGGDPARGGGVAAGDAGPVVRMGISEKDLAEEPGEEVDPGETAVVVLEEVSGASGPDTGAPGQDTVPFQLPAAPWQLELDPDAFASVSSAVLRNAEGMEMVRVTPDAPTAAAELPEGDYLLELNASAEVGEEAVLFAGEEGVAPAPAREGGEGETPEQRRLRVRASAGQGKDLRGLDMAGQRLSKADFRGANLARSDFTGAKVNTSDFQNSIMTGTLMGDAEFFVCRFDEAVMDRVFAPGTDFFNSSFPSAILDRANLSGCPMPKDLQGASFVQVVAFDTKFVDVHARGTDFTSARLIGADFFAADLREAILRGADLTRAKLGAAELEGAIFTDGRVCKPGSRGTCL